MPDSHHQPQDQRSLRWYDGISRFQWTVLVIASLGWIFDVFEGQIFVASMNEAMPDLLPEQASFGDVAYYNQVTFAAFLVGGAVGGVLFGWLSDRIGRVRTMSYTILMYSLFTCVSAFSTQWWHMAAFRFLVAMGVGGEWAVASSMVAEVFPARARAWSGAIFHASSVFGTLLAIVAGTLIVGNPHIGWRWGFVLGTLPALLILWIRLSLKEPESWKKARANPAIPRASLSQLFRGRWGRHALIGVGLAAVGLATFWGVHVFGRDVLRGAKVRELTGTIESQMSQSQRQALLDAHLPTIKRWEMLGMLLVTTGGGIGLVAFGPICERLGRRGAFLLFHIGGLISALVLFLGLSGADPPLIMAWLPLFGFLTLGMHAGYAIYFPELFPTRLRGTGAGFCFNVGRILAAPILILSGWLQSHWNWSLAQAASTLSAIFLVGVLLLLFAPETRGLELPE